MSEPTGYKRPWRGQGALNDATLVPLKTCKNSSCTIYVTKLTLSIVTHANGKLFQMQDTTGTPVVYAKHLDATAAAGVLSEVEWNWPKGLKIATGKDLNGVSESSGIVGYVYAEGYQIIPPSSL